MSKKKKVAKVPAKIRKVANQLIKFFGPKGKHWVSGTEDDGAGHYCLIGALAKLDYDQGILDQYMPLNRIDIDCEGELDSSTQFESAPEFNDRDGWKPIEKLLKLLSKGFNPSECLITEEGKVLAVELKPLKV